MQDAFPHHRIANQGGNEVVHRVLLIPSFFRRSRPPQPASLPKLRTYLAQIFHTLQSLRREG